MWVHAIYKYYFVNKVVQPKKAALNEAKARLAETLEVLEEARDRMREVLEGLDKLNSDLQATMERKEELEANAKLCEDRMGRAFRLVGGLSDERERWIETIDTIENYKKDVVGDILICAGSVAYQTPFTDKYRRDLLNLWLLKVDEVHVPHTANCNLVSTLGEPVTIRTWQLHGLPRDALSTENAILVSNSNRWPLFIDPQGQANRWIKNMGKETGLSVCKLTDRDLMRSLEGSIRLGKPVLIENVGQELDPALDPILTRQIFVQSGQQVIKVGDTIVPYSSDFKLYITTKLPNPHYMPEVAIKVLLVNFTLVPSGLQDQLLALVVMEERPDLEEMRSALVVNSAQMKSDLKDIEDRILFRLTTSQGSPVDDIDLINTLEASKIKSEEIKAKVKVAEETQANIDITRALYIPVANRAQILFFCLADLANVDPMYQYSLEWFINIFIKSIRNTEKSSDIQERVDNINDYFTFSLYSNVCRSLFEKNKLQCAFLLCARILLDSGVLDASEWMFLLSGGSPLKGKSLEPNPDSTWLSNRSWTEILSLENVPSLIDFVGMFGSQVEEYKIIFDSADPHRENFPQPWDTKLNKFQKMIVMKCLRPDKVTNCMQDFITEYLGAKFIEPQTTDLTAIFKDSNTATPLIFVLSPGTDPAADLYKFADKLRMGKRMMSISLGQGQGPIAERMFQDASRIGNWVFFQNCHLAPSWMPRLEFLIETINPDMVHRDFRVWLTSSPSPSFPVAILQAGSKMTVEPPRGVKANLMRAYSNQVVEFTGFMTSENPKVPTFKQLLFSLCLFHAVCLERRKFGPLGFNIPYEFTDGDLRICISQLHMFLLEYTEIPFKVLEYTAGQINYGGRVTDDWDRRCIMNILSDFYNIDVVNDEYSFDDEGVYRQLPGDTDVQDYIPYIKTLPVNDDPNIFGLHANADISCAQAETYISLNILLSLQPRTVGAEAHSQEEVTVNITNNLLEHIPQPFDDIAAIQERYPVLYEESLNTVLVQEVIRFNGLLYVIHSSLKDLIKGLHGLVVLSDVLEKMSTSLFTNAVPDLWANKAYPSLKPLGAWVTDLQERLKFISDWIDSGIPNSFWISGFYFPQAFLTGCLQNYARKYIVAIDSINYTFQILGTPPKSRPADGCVVYGLFLEGARWDAKHRYLVESRPKELYTEMPSIWLVPEQNHVVAETGIYECPVYKTLNRAGVLSTTGHSTNYVVTIEVPSDKLQKHWIKRSVALFCALDY